MKKVRVFFFKEEEGKRDGERDRGVGDVEKRQKMRKRTQSVTRESPEIAKSLTPPPLVTKVTSLHLDGVP